MDIPILIMNVEVFSLNMDMRYLTSSEGVLKYNRLMEIRIPRAVARSFNGGPLIGERYSIRYVDGMINDPYPAEFYYLGTLEDQLIFSQSPPYSTSAYSVPDDETFSFYLPLIRQVPTKV